MGIMSLFNELMEGLTGYTGEWSTTVIYVRNSLLIGIIGSFLIGLIASIQRKKGIRQTGRGPINSMLAYIICVISGFVTCFWFLDDLVGIESFSDFVSAFYLTAGVAGVTGLSMAVSAAKDNFTFWTVLRYITMPIQQIVILLVADIVLAIAGGALSMEAFLIMLLGPGMLFCAGGGTVIILIVGD